MRILPFLLLAACGDVSNSIFEEDADFLAALPSEERHTVTIDEETTASAKGTALGEPAELLSLSLSTAVSANRAVYAVLGTVEDVRALPPSARTAEGRSWGPFDVQEGVEARVEMTRSGTGVYAWAIDLRDADEEATVAWGTHYAGDTVADGDGAFTWDIGTHARLIGGASTGVLEVDYDNRDGVDLLLHLGGWSETGEDPIDQDYGFRRADGQTDFQYRTDWDLPGDAADELSTVQVRSRWADGQGGRSDAQLSGGSMGSTLWRLSQCWSPGGALTFQADTPTIEAWPLFGDEADCPFSDFAEVDRI